MSDDGNSLSMNSSSTLYVGFIFSHSVAYAHSYPNKPISSGPHYNTNHCYDLYHSYSGWMSATKQIILYREQEIGN